MKLLNPDWVKMIDMVHMRDDLRQEDEDFFLGSMEPGTVRAIPFHCIPPTRSRTGRFRAGRKGKGKADMSAATPRRLIERVQRDKGTLQ